MNFRKTVSLVLVLVLFICLFCACCEKPENPPEGTSPEENSPVAGEGNIDVSSPTKNLLDLSSKTYEKSDLLKIIDFNGSIDELNAQYLIECLREKDSLYRAAYLGNDSVAVVWFDQSGSKLFGRLYENLQSKADLADLSECQSLEQVRAIAPDGEYLFLYTGSNDTPRVSSHYTKDGYLITVKYDDSNAIIDINEELI